ncbi:GNAT family N-acetyltransferase [Alcaligenes phage vB_Af_QDWS535]|nr:GNAT family N-acetyltransferase [Alcaligenes phage vB_Af_QDWS535]
MKGFDKLFTTFHEECHYSHIPLSLERCRHAYNVAKTNSRGTMFLREKITEEEGMVGLFIGSIVPMFFSEETQAQDLLFYVLPEHRGTPWFVRTLREFEQWAKEKGAAQVVLYTDTGINPDKLKTFLTRSDYIQSGRCFNKEI